MDTLMVLQSDIPKLGPNTKDVINNGIWYLFKLENENPEYVYLLETRKSWYYLNKDGFPVKEFNYRPPGIKLIANVYFSDLPFPKIINELMKVLKGG